MAGAPATIGHNRRRALHDGFPIRIGHVSHQNITSLDLIHLRKISHDPHPTRANFLSDRTTRKQDLTRRFQTIALLNIVMALLRLYGFGASLQNIDFAIDTVASPFNIHGSLIVFFDDDGVTRQFNDLVSC